LPERPDDRPEDDENVVFVTSSIEDAVARARQIAGDKEVGVNGGEIARQCFDAGLLDEVHVDLVPVFPVGPATASLVGQPSTVSCHFSGLRSTRRSSWALRATTIVEADMSTAAIAGLNASPAQASTPAASGIAMTL